MPLLSSNLSALILGVVRSIAPLSFVLVAFRVWAYVTGRRQNLLLSRTTFSRRLINMWLLLEAAFFVFCRVQGERLQAQPPPHRVIRLSAVERRNLILRCLATSEAPEQFAVSWLKSKHTFSALKRDNIREWLAWGLFHEHDWHAMSREDQIELDELISIFEQTLHTPLPPGFNPGVELYKFSSEPVVYSHRPLALYAVLHFALQEVAAPLIMGANGFSRHRQGSLVYWHRRGVDPELPPLVFVHGLGVGVTPYKATLEKLCALCDTPEHGLSRRALIVLELQAVSMRLLPAELHRDEFVANVRAMLTSNGHTHGAMFAGHSYGSFTLAWLVHRAPDLVRGLALLDPACLLLHMPSVMTNILYRGADNAYDRLLNYMVREELFFNAHARRHFFWFANALFLEDIDTVATPVIVVLSELDDIIPVKHTKAYIERYNGGERLPGAKSLHGSVQLVYLDNVVHGGFLTADALVDKVVSALDLMAQRV